MLYQNNTLQDMFVYFSNILNKASISNSSNEIIWYLEKLKLINKETMYIKNFTSEELSFIRKKIEIFVNERLTGKPFQHIINEANFYGRNLYVNQHVLIPRPETELLIDKLLKKEFNYALDIGTGSANLSITLIMEKIATRVLAIDISSKALRVAKNNINKYNINQIELKKINFLTHSFNNQKFDLIVSNPPYISKKSYSKLSQEVKGHEPKIALTDNDTGITFYKHLSKVIQSILSNKGLLVFEIGIDQNISQVCNLFKEIGYQCAVSNDYNNIPRIVEIYK